MAYEDLTYEVILLRLMERVIKDYPNLDRREGSIIFNALASAAVEFAIAYDEIDNSRKQSFVKTATRHFALLGCEQMGMDVSVFEASAGTHKCEFDVEVNIGSRWNCELFNYKITEYVGLEDGLHIYKAVCETLGTAPNNQTGDLTPIDEVPSNLTIARITECLIEGENETSDEDIKNAYFDYVKNTVSDGNVAQYERWCREYEGIGNAKILPLWNGANTVKVSILSVSNRAASQTLIDEFQEYLDPGIEGMGNGVAPIGAFVTVSTATEIPINVSATISFGDGYSDTTAISTYLEKYFADISYEKKSVAYMNVGAAILNTEGVEFITDLTINDSTNDITLGDEEIPVLGEVSWTVV
jgi:uncharacterized phage protein gp47/JayE